MKKTITITIVSLIATAGFASAANISLSFDGNSNLGLVGSDTLIEVAGVNGVQAQDWVNLVGSSAASADIDGGAGSATISFTTGYTLTTGNTFGTESHNLMDGAIRLGGGTDVNPIVSGLGTDYTSSGYDVYVYFGSDGHNRTHRFTLGGINNSGLENAGQAYNGAFAETNADGDVGNYMVFNGLTAASFTISDNGSSGGGGLPAIAGIEIVSVPEPSSAALLGLGGLALILRRRN